MSKSGLGNYETDGARRGGDDGGGGVMGRRTVLLHVMKVCDEAWSKCAVWQAPWAFMSLVGATLPPPPLPAASLCAHGLRVAAQHNDWYGPTKPCV